MNPNGSPHPMMLRSAIIISILSAGTSLVSFVNQLLIARYFGASLPLDAYLVAVSVPSLFMGLIAGVFSYSIVPILVRRKTKDPEGYQQYSGSMFLVFIGLALCLPLSAYFLVPALIRVLIPTLPTAFLEKTVLMSRVSWATVGCTIIVHYLVAAQNSARKFVVPVLANFLPYLGMIVAMVFLSRRLGVATLVWGMLFGYLLAIPVLYPGATAEIMIRGFRSTSWNHVTPVFSSMPLVLVSMLCFTVYGTIDAFWASRLGPGNLSYLGYGQRLLISLGNVVVLGPGTVLTPYLSEQSAVGLDMEFRRTVGKAVRMIIVFAAPVAMCISLLRIPVIELLFQRGAFDPLATLGVASVLPGMLCGMVAMVSVVLLFRALFAAGDVSGAALIGGGGAVLYFGLSGILSQWLGLQGIVLSYAITWWSLLGFSVWRLWRNIYHFWNLSHIKFAANMLVAMLVGGGIIFVGKYILIRPLVEIGPASLSLRVIISFFLGGGGFIAIAAGLFRMPEIDAILKFSPRKYLTDRVGVNN